LSKGMRKVDSDSRATAWSRLQRGIISIDSGLQRVSGQRIITSKVRWNPFDFLFGRVRGQVLALFMIAVFQIAIGAFVWMLTGGHASYDTSFNQSLWFSWGMFFDPGTETSFSAESKYKVKIVAVVFTIFGYVFNLLFLGLIVEIVRNKMAEFQRRHSRIVANDHTVLLGWSEKSLYVIRELLHRADNKGDKMEIVLLADVDKLEMWQELRRQFPAAKQQQAIRVRRGKPTECNDLERASVLSARDIIVVGGSGDPNEEDLHTGRVILALAALQPQPQGSIIAEVRTAEMSGAISQVLDNAEGIFARNAVMRALCLTALHPAVGDTFQSLMTWSSGAEIYCKHLDEIGAGGAQTVGEAEGRISHGVVMGVLPEDNMAVMVPARHRPLTSTDRLLVLAESEVELNSNSRGIRPADQLSAASCGSWPAFNFTGPTSCRTVIIVGWPADIDALLHTMDDFIAPGSVVTILSELEEQEREHRLSASFPFKPRNFRLKHHVGHICSILALSRLPLADCRAILVLPDSGFTGDTQMSDSACLASAITIDGLLKGEHREFFVPADVDHRPRLICSVLSAVIERALPDSHKLRRSAAFFAGNALETGLFTIASSQAPVYNAILMLLQPNSFGQIYTRRVTKYTGGEGEISFEQCAQMVRQNGEVLMGSVSAASGRGSLNPRRLGVLRAADDLIVLGPSVAPPVDPELLAVFTPDEAASAMELSTVVSPKMLTGHL